MIEDYHWMTIALLPTNKRKSGIFIRYRDMLEWMEKVYEEHPDADVYYAFASKCRDAQFAKTLKDGDEAVRVSQ